MPSNFSPDFYESILEASDRGELWGIENSDLTPLEVQLILSHDFSWYTQRRDGTNLGIVFAFGIAAKLAILTLFLAYKYG